MEKLGTNAMKSHVPDLININIILYFSLILTFFRKANTDYACSPSKAPIPSSPLSLMDSLD